MYHLAHLTFLINLCSYFCLPANVSDPSPGYFDCPRGYYCPAGTGADIEPCPPGTYSNVTNLYNVVQCKDCPEVSDTDQPMCSDWTQYCQSVFSFSTLSIQSVCDICHPCSVNKSECSIGSILSC